MVTPIATSPGFMKHILRKNFYQAQPREAMSARSLNQYRICPYKETANMAIALSNIY